MEGAYYGFILPKASEILFISFWDITKGICGHFAKRNSTSLKKKKARFFVVEISGQGMKKGGCPSLNKKTTDR